MTETRELICISCPLGCALTVTLKDGKAVKVQGNTCPKGEAYGKKETTAPARILTSSVRVSGGFLPVVSVKTASDIPKGKIEECARALRDLEVQAPVQIGDIILRDVCHTGVNIIATKNVRSRQEERQC